MPIWATCGGAHDLPEPVAQLHGSAVGVSRPARPRGAPSVRLGLGDGDAARVGQGEDPSALGLGRGDQALVGEHLQRRVDRPGAGPPHAAAALGELGDDLVAVHRLLGEQPQDRQPDVSATRPGAASTTAVATATAPRVEPGPEGRAEPRAEAGRRAAVPAAATAAGLVGHRGDVQREGRVGAVLVVLAVLAVRAEGAGLGAGEEGTATASAAVSARAAARAAPVGRVAEGLRALGAIGGAGLGGGDRGKYFGARHEVGLLSIG